MNRENRNEALKRFILAFLAVLASAVLLVGITMSWLTYRYRLSSIGKIHPPAYISILEPGDAVMQFIDLSYDKSEVHNGKVELKRPIVIRSEIQQYDLCIAHTTNISGLKISLYKAEANGSEGNADLAGITEKGKPYYWNKQGGNLFTESGYLNSRKDNTTILADQSHKAHEETFRLTEEMVYSNVQKHAEPLYWVKKGIQGRKRPQEEGKAADPNYYTNYILEITWDETDKETDILYVIAQTSSDSVGNNQSE